MCPLSLEEREKIIKDIDSRSFQKRVERLGELHQIKIERNVGVFGSQRVWEYGNEATHNYLNGSYRSTIFCCACIVDHIFRYEYLSMPGSTLADLRQKNTEITFGKVIEKCEIKCIETSSNRLDEYISKAKLLNKIRKKVAVHPLFIDIPEELPNSRLKDEILIEGMNSILNLVKEISPSEYARLDTGITSTDVEGKNTRYELKDILSKPASFAPRHILFFFIGFIEWNALQFLAYESLKIVRDIDLGLYGKKYLDSISSS